MLDLNTDPDLFRFVVPSEVEFIESDEEKYNCVISLAKLESALGPLMLILLLGLLEASACLGLGVKIVSLWHNNSGLNQRC